VVVTATVERLASRLGERGPNLGAEVLLARPHLGGDDGPRRRVGRVAGVVHQRAKLVQQTAPVHQRDVVVEADKRSARV
jgi:hypothetical protein